MNSVKGHHLRQCPIPVCGKLRMRVIHVRPGQRAWIEGNVAHDADDLDVRTGHAQSQAD
jgi:hypothetical protein